MKILTPTFNFVTGIGARVQATPGRVWRWSRVARWRQGLLVVSVPVLLASTLMLFPGDAHATVQSAGPNHSTSGGTTNYFTYVNGSNINAEDGAYATNSCNSANICSRLDAEGFGFSLSSSTTAINGIEVDIKKWCANTAKNQMEDNNIQLIKANTLTGNNKAATGVAWPTSNSYTTYGGSTDTWGISGLTYSDINNSGFGVELQGFNHKIGNPGGALTSNVDYIKITVWYTIPPLLTQAAYRFYSNSGSTFGSGNGDGATWTKAKNSGSGWNTRRGMSSTSWNGAMWVAGGVDNGNNYKNDVWYSTNGTTWTEATSAAAWGTRMGAVLLTFNNKLWLIGGFLGTGAPVNDVWYSTDGANWTQSSCGTTCLSGGARQYANGFVYNNLMWVMGGLGNASAYEQDVYSSSDGVTWTQTTCGTTCWGGNGRMMEGAGVLGSTMYIWGGVGTGSTNLNSVYCSTNSGASWSTSTCGTASAAFTGRFGQTSLVYNSKLWLFGGEGSVDQNDVWYSSDGVTWTQATSAAAWSGRMEATSLVYNSQMWVMGGSQFLNGLYMDDVYWSDGSGQTVDVGSSLAAVNTNITSPGDGVPFRLRIDLAVSQAQADVEEVGLNLQYATLSGTCAASTYSNVTDSSAVRFYNTNSPNVNNAENVANSNLPADGSNTLVPQTYWQQGQGSDWFTNEVATPTGQDGVWDFALSTYRTQPSTSYCFRISTNAGAAINSYTVYPEITTPSVTTTDSSYRFFSNQDAPNTASAWASSTTTAYSTGREGGSMLSYNGAMYYIGGNGTGGALNTVYCSTTGSTWTNSSTANSCGTGLQGTSAAAFSARYGPAGTVFNGAMYIAGGSGDTNDVWCSTNGSTWVTTSSGSNPCGTGLGGTASAGWGGRYAAQLLSFNNKLWFMGGANGNFNYNDVWCSSDGTTWSDTTCGTSGAPWIGRSQFAAWVKDGKMWIAGGVSGSIYFNDVWNTSDGTTWTQVTSGADWSARYALTSAVHDDLLWVYGGYDGGYKDDAWYSSDGVHWTQQTSAATATGRFLPEAVTFNNKLWISGGLNGSGGYQNDVFSYSFGGIDVGSALASQNHALDLHGNAMSTPFRLRWDVNLGGASQSANGTASLQLEYAAMSGGSCSATPSGNFAVVTNATPIKFDSSLITTGTNGMPAQPNVNDPTDGTNTVSYQQMIDSNSGGTAFTNTKLLIGGNEDGLFDFSLSYGGSSRDTNYCLRIHDTANSTTYSQYAQVNVGPSMIQLLAHRAWWNSSGVKQNKDIK